MAWDIVQWGQFYTILMIGFALGMDAFSLGIGLGTLGIRLRTIAKISLTIGLFHILMPLLGIFTGMFLTKVVGSVASFIGGIILCYLGIQMFWAAIFKGDEDTRATRKIGGIEMLLFSLSVSMDALSVGFSFGLFAVNVWLAVVVFGILGMLMSAIGLLLGKRVGHRLGTWGEVIGGVILFAFGLKFLF
ncbi:putative Mn2+ efflux pump MntP [Ammoniphilus resinae]|uniref:Putative manganese efflux pump MntP n=1 Tax=Ammoniphilus resinae TaxID=861532 RepID=A0ABS4GUS4_9BACL|nr:putative Mn2+ efflux pump MntP [Ammoniphilus resinae]